MRAAVFVLVGGLSAAAPLAAQTEAPATRGALLYAAHCGACHSTQMHWRDNRSATDWPSLVLQVRRWQGTVQLGWSDDDIDEVARHLNETIYRFPVRGGRLIGAAPPR